MKALTILGARPQFIKASPVSRALKAEGIDEVIVHTGQHFDENMSKIFFDEMGIPEPHYNLEVHGLGHGAMTGRMLEKIESVLLKEKPDVVIVYGDTNSTIAGALAAKKLHIKVAHIEAGLRSFNMKMPEEINRILTDRISDFLFCPTTTALENLKKEGFENIDCKITNSGDVMYDAFLQFSDIAQEKSTILSDQKLSDRKYILCTVHRQENTDDKQRFGEIVRTLNTVAEEATIVFPVHPRTQQLLGTYSLHKNIRIIPPVGYLDMVSLINHSMLVMTDSGGLQKEAFFARKYCITLREETEWVELVNGGFNKTVGLTIMIF
ncbi:MAG: UDP-N-acetylglucosamine 2-epimerase (non-hydrolyzing) [Cyclobacteriaceae bacterium]|nr:UDP-N-acetylglucosamine 2-epimerase (non-hydrolyzing) [Cyclobacteriaceae bacterium]